MNDPPKDWSAADWEQWRDVVEGYAPRALSDRERHRPDLTEAEYSRLLEQRRAAPSRNPLLPPAPGEIDPLPPYLRAAVAELKEVLATMDKETRRWYIKERCRHAAKALSEGKALPDTERQWLAAALAAIGDGHSPQAAFFGRSKPGLRPRATNNLIRRLVRLVWHDKKQRIRPEYAAAGYSFITEGKPPWIAAKQAVAFKWVGEAVGLEEDEVRKRYREKVERSTPAAPLPWEDRAIESNGAATRNSARPAGSRPANFTQATPRHHRADEPLATPSDTPHEPPPVDTGLVSTDEHTARREDDRLTAAPPVDVELATRAARIVAYLRVNGGSATRTDLIAKCFQRNLKAADLDAALEWAQMQTPPWVEVRKVPKRGARSSQTAVEVRLPQTPREGDECDECGAVARSRSHS
jgi:hypothetical protein